MFVEFSYECPAMTQAKPYTNVVTSLQSWSLGGPFFPHPCTFYFTFLCVASFKQGRIVQAAGAIKGKCLDDVILFTYMCIEACR